MYNKADIGKMCSTISSVKWADTLKDKTPDQMVDLFQDKFIATMNTYIPNKNITIKESDAPWVTPEVKSFLRKNRRVFKKWIDRGRPPDGKDIVTKTQCETNKIISNAKKKYTSDMVTKFVTPVQDQNVSGLPSKSY